MMTVNRAYKDDVFKFWPKLNNESLDLILTDPPYGTNSKGKTNDFSRVKIKEDRFEWDRIDLIPFTTKWFEIVLRSLKQNSWMFVFWSQKYLREGMNIFKPSRVLVWHYSNLVNGGKLAWAYDWEPIFVMKKGRPKLFKSGKYSSILEYTKPQSNFIKDKALYPTQKPLELCRYLIRNCSKENDIVGDPFCGGGTTLVAAKELGRDFIGCDKERRAIEVTKKRLKHERK